MKFTVQMKDPDTLGDAIREAVTEELKSNESLRLCDNNSGAASFGY